MGEPETGAGPAAEQTGRTGQESAVARPAAIPDDLDDPLIEKAVGVVELPLTSSGAADAATTCRSGATGHGSMSLSCGKETRTTFGGPCAVTTSRICGTTSSCPVMSERPGKESWPRAKGSPVLTDLQARIARLVAELPEADGFALAGGAGLIVHQVTDRTTNDLDFFTPRPADVAVLCRPSNGRFGSRGTK